MNSRDKGKRGELDFARELGALGHYARRGQQRAGGEGSPDVVHDIPGVHFEVKRTQSFTYRTALDQAIRDAGNNMPVVAHRYNSTRVSGRYEGYAVILRLADFVTLCDKARAHDTEF